MLHRSRIAGLLVVAVSVVGLGVACSDDEKSASDKVCDARSELSSDMQQVGSDLGAGNFGDARSNLDEVKTSFDNLVDEADKLADNQKQELSPQLDQVKTDVSSLTNVRSLDELRTALDTTQQDVQSALSNVQSDLNCG
jgi:hypothetical protein